MNVEERLICSARDCEADAQYTISWNNPKVHQPERRKTWLACSDHEPSLRDFLARRGFYLDTSGVAE